MNAAIYKELSDIVTEHNIPVDHIREDLSKLGIKVSKSSFWRWFHGYHPMPLELYLALKEILMVGNVAFINQFNYDPFMDYLFLEL